MPKLERSERLTTNRFARHWNNPDDTLLIERGRYPTQRALANIVRSVFHDHVHAGDRIFEVGAGQGYLRDLIPNQYYSGLVSSDYNHANLHAGRQLRELRAVAASAIELPLADASIDVVIDMDAYDTLPHLKPALDEVYRVLRPRGKYIHLQRNMPTEDIIFYDHPNMIFFPTGRGKLENPYLTGMTEDDLRKGMLIFQNPALQPYGSLLSQFLDDPVGSYFSSTSFPELPQNSNLLGELLDLIPGDKLAIPSLHEYFRGKLEKAVTKSGLEFVESGYRESSDVLPRSEAQMEYPQANLFLAKNGKTGMGIHPLLNRAGIQGVVEATNMLVVVAQKPDTKQSQ
jgi:SAM-dependent methyltransferase